MNSGIIIYLLGWIMNIEALFLMIPCLTAAVYGESIGFCYLAVAAACGLIGFLCVRKKPASKIFFAREGFVTVSLGWIILSLFGCMPFLLGGEITRFEDALFEIVSGFTTTGASILDKVEDLSKASLIWRSFSHWIGGMGILVFLLAVLPMTGDYNMHIMRAESPGPSVGKLVPKIRFTAKLLYSIYLFLTVVMFLLLLAGKMPLFDSLCMTFGAAGTGGFSCRNFGQAGYTAYQQNVITIFMLLFGVNFNVYYLFLIRKPKDAFKCEELRGYLVIVVAAIVLITLNTWGMFPDLRTAVHHVAFQVASIITTTGYSTVDFNQWPELSRALLVIIMFIGACAGSTGGGIKVSRIIILFKGMSKELQTMVQPRQIKKIKMDSRIIDHETVRSVNVYMVAYLMIFAISLVLISFDNHDLITSFTAVTATINNIGPGLDLVGPTSNFGLFTMQSKIVLIFDMLAGRLELFPMLLLFTPATWKK